MTGASIYPLCDEIESIIIKKIIKDNHSSSPPSPSLLLSTTSSIAFSKSSWVTKQSEIDAPSSLASGLLWIPAKSETARSNARLAAARVTPDKEAPDIPSHR